MIHLDIRAATAVVTIDRPERRNALDHDALGGLETALDGIEGSECRAVVLTGTDGHFCSGADISGVEDPAFVARLGGVLRRLRVLPMPTIAAVDGFCLGAGTQLAVACDLRMATATSRFGVPAGKLGVMVDWWTVQRVATSMGQGAARDLFLTADQIPGQRAYDLGLVQRLGGLAEALAWAEAIAGLAPLTLRGLKLGLNEVESLEAEPPVAFGQAFDRAWASADLQEGLAAFHDRRPPEFTAT